MSIALLFRRFILRITSAITTIVMANTMTPPMQIMTEITGSEGAWSLEGWSTVMVSVAGSTVELTTGSVDVGATPVWFTEK